MLEGCVYSERPLASLCVWECGGTPRGRECDRFACFGVVSLPSCFSFFNFVWHLTRTSPSRGGVVVVEVGQALEARDDLRRVHACLQHLRMVGGVGG
jgi:hypothetical protein